MTYHHVNLSLAFLYHEHTPQSNRLISIVTSKGVPHARDKILITSPLAGSNLQDLMKHVQKNMEMDYSLSQVFFSSWILSHVFVFLTSLTSNDLSTLFTVACEQAINLAES